MERAKERNDVLALGVIACQLQSALNGLRARVAVVKLVRTGHGRDLRKPFGEFDHALVIDWGGPGRGRVLQTRWGESALALKIEPRARLVNQSPRLLLHCCNHMRM